MDGISPTPQLPKQQTNIFFITIFIGIILLLLLLILNYFNILRLSKIFPQLGFLPHKPYGQQTTKLNSLPQPTSIQPATKALANLLPNILTSSFLPKSPFEITLTEDRDDKERFNASWSNKGEGAGTLWAVFPKPSNSKKITSVDVFFEKIQTASPSVELAKSGVNQIFSSNPKGKWGCSRDPLNERKVYCENFWEEEEAKKGVGFLIINTSPSRGRLVFSFCEHSKDSNLYSWKSCRAEFAESGVR